MARQLAPMISTFIRAQWESGELEDVDDERRRFLRKQRGLITFGMSGRWRKNRPTFFASGLGNHPKVETT